MGKNIPPHVSSSIANAVRNRVKCNRHGVYTYMTLNAKGRQAVTGRVITFIFGPFLTLRIFREFFGSFYRFYRYVPNFYRNCLKFCMKLAKNDAKVTYFLN